MFIEIEQHVYFVHTGSTHGKYSHVTGSMTGIQEYSLVQQVYNKSQIRMGPALTEFDSGNRECHCLLFSSDTLTPNTIT